MVGQWIKFYPKDLETGKDLTHSIFWGAWVQIVRVLTNGNVIVRLVNAEIEVPRDQTSLRNLRKE